MIILLMNLLRKKVTGNRQKIFTTCILDGDFLRQNIIYLGVKD